MNIGTAFLAGVGVGIALGVIAFGVFHLVVAGLFVAVGAGAVLYGRRLFNKRGTDDTPA